MCFFHIRWIQLDFKSLVGTEITQSLEAKEPGSQTDKQSGGNGRERVEAKQAEVAVMGAEGTGVI